MFYISSYFTITISQIWSMLYNSIESESNLVYCVLPVISRAHGSGNGKIFYQPCTFEAYRRSEEFIFALILHFFCLIWEDLGKLCSNLGLFHAIWGESRSGFEGKSIIEFGLWGKFCVYDLNKDFQSPPWLQASVPLSLDPTPRFSFSLTGNSPAAMSCSTLSCSSANSLFFISSISAFVYNQSKTKQSKVANQSIHAPVP